MELLNALVILTNFLPVFALIIGLFMIKKNNKRLNFGIFLLILFFLLRAFNEIFYVIETRYFFTTVFQVFWFLGMLFLFLGVDKK